MSELPDLDTTEMGLTAYWNAIDDGDISASEYNPTEAVQYGALTGWESYDNGIEGTLGFGLSDFSNVELNFRIKSDGWHVVWNERADDFYYSSAGQSPSNDTEWYDVLEDFAGITAPTATFDQADCGLYDYKHEPDELWLFYEGVSDGSSSSAYVYFEPPSVLERADIYSNAGGYSSYSYISGLGPLQISDGTSTATELNLDPETVYESHADSGGSYICHNTVSLLISK